MNKNLKRNIIALLIITIIVSFLFVFIFKDDEELNEEVVHQYYEYNNKQYKQNDDLQLILFAGLDSYDNNIVDSYRNDELSDCLVLLVLNKNDKTILPIQINRDTMCEYYILGIGGRITGTSFGQIALPHSYGTGNLDSLVNTKDAVEMLLNDIDIDCYLSLPMNAVSIINDNAGGVEVYVEDDFSSIDETLVQGEKVLLLGEHSLTFVRSRQGLDDSSNIARLNRQRVYLRALFEKCKYLVNSDSSFVSECLNSVNDYLISNTNIYGLSDLCNTLLEYELLDAVQLKGEAKKGETYIEYYLDEDYLNDFCLNTFYQEIR